MKCKSCGRQNRKGILFCEECGESLGTPAYSSRVCSECNFENRAGVEYCENCGDKLQSPSKILSPTCPSCGYSNRTGVQFCENCGRSLTGVKRAKAPAVSPFKRYKMPVILSMVIAVCVCMILIYNIRGRISKGAPDPEDGITVTFPDFGDFSSLNASQAEQIGDAVVSQLYPEFKDKAASVSEELVNDNRILNVNYGITIQTEDGSFEQDLIIAINTNDQSITILESN